MKTVIAHPFGNQNVRHALSGFQQKGILDSFHTSIAVFEGDFGAKCSSLPFLGELKRRMFDSALCPFTYSYPIKEAGRQLAIKLGTKFLFRHEKGCFSTDMVAQYLDAKVAQYLKRQYKTFKGITAMYGYEDSSLESFTQAKDLGFVNHYDLPIGYWRAARNFLGSTCEQWPEWAATITAFQDSEDKLNRKEQEISLSNQIIVASSFTAQTLGLFPGELPPVKVIPYGFPPVNQKRQYDVQTHKPLRVLYAGSLSQRKGIAELFHAVAPLKPFVQLTLIGRVAGFGCKELEGFLNQHKWIPSLSHTEMLQQMAAHDVLIFPSHFEGFGLVITEAMSQGTPVITTNRTAGPDVIDDGIDGWIVETGSIIALRNAIESLLIDRQSVVQTGMMARKKAALRPWSKYGAELASAIIDGKKNTYQLRN